MAQQCNVISAGVAVLKSPSVLPFRVCPMVRKLVRNVFISKIACVLCLVYQLVHSSAQAFKRMQTFVVPIMKSLQRRFNGMKG